MKAIAIITTVLVWFAAAYALVITSFGSMLAHVV